MNKERCEAENGRFDTPPGWCPGKWDSLLCWLPTPPNTTTEQLCPFGISKGNASRFCTDAGRWFAVNEINVHQQTHGWTNLSECVRSPQLSVEVLKVWLPIIKTTSLVGYSVSLVTLIIACIILVSFRRLHCPRNWLHLHLFASFILRAGTTLIKSAVMHGGLGLKGAVTNGTGAIDLDQEDGMGFSCKLLVAVWHFSLVANYAWILTEGLYLHNLIFLALFTDSSSIRLYALLGWALPVVVVSMWIMARSIWDDTMCWNINHVDGLVWIYEAPILLSVFVNFVLFINVSRVLLLKLRAGVSHETTAEGYKKWAKSTLVLVPLFGVNYVLLVGFEHSARHIHVAVEICWLLLDQLFASFQGFFVAILYCFMNGEVRSEVSKKWLAWRESQGPATRRLLGTDSRLLQPRAAGHQSCTLDIPGGSTAFTSGTDIHGERSFITTGVHDIHQQMDCSEAGGLDGSQCMMEVEIPGSNGEAGIPMIRIVKSASRSNGSSSLQGGGPASPQQL